MPRLAVAAGDPLQAEEEALAWLPATPAPTRRYPEDLTAEALFNDLGQPGMFAETKSLLYCDIFAVRLNKRESERIAALLAALPADTHLACIQVVREESKRKGDEKLRKAEWQLFAYGAQLRDIRDLAEGPRAQRWLAQRANARYGLQLRPDQAGRILAVCDSTPSLADAELQKLSLLAADKNTGVVSDTQLDGILAASPAAKFYELLDQLLAAPRQAQPALHAWFDAEGETFRLIYEIKNRLLQVRRLERGESAGPAFLARQAEGLRRRLGGGRLGQALEALAALEFSLKSGVVPGESSRQSELAALQLFTAQLARIYRG